MANYMGKLERYKHREVMLQRIERLSDSESKEEKRDPPHWGAFHKSKKWKSLRNKIIEFYGKKCMRCGSEEKTQVDHIKPKSDFPALAFCASNLQVLCWDCNRWKWNEKNHIDYRPCVRIWLPAT